LLLGRITIQWTTIQAAISRVFRRLSGLDAAKAEAVFFAVKSDTSQRDMTLALGRVVLDKHPELLERTIKLFNRLGDLSGERNAVTHAIWAVNLPEGRITPMPSRGQHRRLKIDNHRAQLDRLLRDLSEMFRDLVKLEADIRTVLTDQSGKTDLASRSQTTPNGIDS
jgi:hypothetical protein